MNLSKERVLMNIAITSKIQASFLVQYVFEESNVGKESHNLEISI